MTTAEGQKGEQEEASTVAQPTRAARQWAARQGRLRHADAAAAFMGPTVLENTEGVGTDWARVAQGDMTSPGEWVVAVGGFEQLF